MIEELSYEQNRVEQLRQAKEDQMREMENYDIAEDQEVYVE